MLSWQPEFQSNQLINPMQPFPLPDDDLQKFKRKIQVTLKDDDGGQYTLDHCHTNTSLEPSGQVSKKANCGFCLMTHK